MTNYSLKRNIFTEKLFEAIEEPWSNESTPSSTPAKQIQKARNPNGTLLTVHIQESCVVNNDGLRQMLESTTELLDDEPDFIVWKLAEKMFLRHLRHLTAKAFAGWISEITRAMKSKRMSHKSRILYRRKLQQKMFNSWYGSIILISRLGKKKSDVENFLKTKTRKCIIVYFEYFKRSTLSIYAKSAINRRCCIRLLRSCIDKWRKLSAARARNYTKSLKMAYKLCLRASFRSWMYLAKSNRRLHSVLCIFRRRMIRKNVNMCFKRWHQSKMASSSIPTKNLWLAHHLDALQQKRSIAAIKAWKRVAALRRQVRSVFLKTLCRKLLAGRVTYESWCMQSAIITWQEKIRKKHDSSCQSSANQTRSAKNIPIATIFRSWSRCCIVDRRTKLMAQRHFQMKLVIALKRCFYIWKMVAKALHVANAKCDNIFKYRNINRKTRAFMVWRHVLAASSTSSILSANSFRVQTLKRKQVMIWNRWKQRALHKVKLQRAYKSRARIRLSTVFSLRTMFWEWKMGILSEQFFASYIMKRFLGLWRQLLSSRSTMFSPLETKTKNAAVAIAQLDLAFSCGTRPYSMAQIYKRKVLRHAVHGWAWTCSERSALLEKLQIAYMIRSSIRTCTKYFVTWSNETLKNSQSSISKQPANLVLEKTPFEPMDAEQRTFEILNIALVERILLCNISKRLVQKSFRSWLQSARSSSAIYKTFMLRIVAFSFSNWVEIGLRRNAERSLKRVTPVFKRWKWLACRSSALREIVVKLQNQRNVLQKHRGMDAWYRFTFGATNVRTNKSLEKCSDNQFAWKIIYFAFRAWHGWTKTSTYRFQHLEDVARSKSVDDMSRNNFNAWMLLSKQFKRSKKLAATNILRSISLAFKCWSRCTFVKRKADKLILSIQNYQATSMLVLCWNAWRGGLEQRNYRTLTLSVTGKLIQKCNAVSVPVRIAWNAWRNFISTRRFVRSAREKIVRQVCEKVHLRNMFRRWKNASRRRRSITIALAKPCTTSLRRAFFALKYNIVRSVFFARQYKRLSQKFRRQSGELQGQTFSKSHAENVVPASPKCDSRPDIITLEEKVLELQSEKIELMEQLKSALQEKQKELNSPTFIPSSEQEIQQKCQVTEHHDRNKSSRPLQHNNSDTSSVQRPSFPVQSRGQHSIAAGKTLPTNATYHQHPLFPVLSQNEQQSQGAIYHQDTKVIVTLFHTHCPHTRIIGSFLFRIFVIRF
jgi:hypothetical protein